MGHGSWVMSHEALVPESLLEGLRLLKGNSGWELRHIFRDKNRYADFLAKKARQDKWRWHRIALPALLAVLGSYGKGNRLLLT